MRCLLDTNIVSEISKRTPNPGVLEWFDAAEDADLAAYRERVRREVGS